MMHDKIGSFKPRNRVFLAPMLEPNDIAFRLLCKKAGSGLNFNGMINPLSKQELVLDDSPALQIFCIKTKGIKEFIKKYEKKVPLFDFNLGCPSTLAAKMGFGSFMHNDIDSIEKILKEMRESTKKPITIKIRKSENAEKIIKMAEKYVDAITIHPRTQKQGYSGDPDMEFALKVKRETSLPIIYSGNVTAKNAHELLKHFDFIMIGREAIGNPNIFSEIKDILGKEKQGVNESIGRRQSTMIDSEAQNCEQHKRKNFQFKDYLKLAKKYNLYFRQIKLQAMNFTKSKENAKKLREEIGKAETIQDIEKAFNSVESQ
jgi:tRNA-dihydrouridine synthase B